MKRLIIICFVVLFSCSIESSEIGSDFFNGGAIDLSLIDSSSVVLSTIKFDELQTNNTARILAGSFTDDKLGKMTAIPFVQFTIPAVTADDLSDENPVFSYAALVLKYDDYFINDTTKTLTLKPYAITADITVDDDGKIYNTTLFDHDENPLGTHSFLPKPVREDSIEIKLSDEWGKEVFQKVLDKSEDITDQTKFTRYFKGLCIVPDSTVSSSIIGFTSAPEVRLYYDDKTVVPSLRKYISFSATQGLTSTWIHGNRNETTLESLLNSRQKISATETYNESYMQAGTGLALRVDMPYLRNLTQFENFYVAKAVLYLYPVRKSYSTSNPLPDNLTVFTVDARNSITGYLEETAVLVEDNDLGRDTHYQLEITGFVKSQMALEEFNDNALIFLTGDTEYRTTVNHLYMAGPQYDYKTRLIIYYASLNF